MKKFLLSFLGLTIFLASSITAAAFYDDVPARHKYYNSIKELYELDRLPKDDQFHPDEAVTTAEFYKILISYSQVELSKSTEPLPYKDADSNADYAPYLRTAIERGLLIPQSANPELGANSKMGKFGILQTFFKSFGIGTSYFFDQDTFIFTDVSSNTFAGPIAQKALEMGIVESDPRKFRMGKRPTRGEIADYLHKINTFAPGPQLITVQLTSAGTSYTKSERNLVEHESFDTLLDVWTSLHEGYLYKDELDDQELIFDAIQGLLAQTPDEYTVFQKPEESSNLVSTLSGEYEGIGIVMELINENITIVSPFKDSPAEKAGLQSNDIIVKVNDEDIVGMNLDTVASKIKGPAGSTVNIGVLRNNRSLNYDVTRDAILRTTVSHEMLNGKVGYINITNFSADTYNEFLTAANALIDEDMQKLVIDVRSNPGGYMDITVQIISLFTENPETAVTLEYADGHTENYITNANGLLKDYKTIVLINGGSASASEILAGALKDLGLATIIGTQSFGKGSVQELKQYPDGSLFKYTISRWLTPDGTDINGDGIAPHIFVENNGNDLQLDRALDEL